MINSGGHWISSVNRIVFVLTDGDDNSFLMLPQTRHEQILCDLCSPAPKGHEHVTPTVTTRLARLAPWECCTAAVARRPISHLAHLASPSPRSRRLC